jgi:hypothetical protein
MPWLQMPKLKSLPDKSLLPNAEATSIAIRQLENGNKLVPEIATRDVVFGKKATVDVKKARTAS